MGTGWNNRSPLSPMTASAGKGTISRSAGEDERIAKGVRHGMNLDAKAPANTPRFLPQRNSALPPAAQGWAERPD